MGETVVPLAATVEYFLLDHEEIKDMNILLTGALNEDCGRLFVTLYFAGFALIPTSRALRLTECCQTGGDLTLT